MPIYKNYKQFLWVNNMRKLALIVAVPALLAAFSGYWWYGQREAEKSVRLALTEYGLRGELKYDGVAFNPLTGSVSLKNVQITDSKLIDFALPIGSVTVFDSEQEKDGFTRLHFKLADINFNALEIARKAKVDHSLAFVTRILEEPAITLITLGYDQIRASLELDYRYDPEQAEDRLTLEVNGDPLGNGELTFAVTGLPHESIDTLADALKSSRQDAEKAVFTLVEGIKGSRPTLAEARIHYRDNGFAKRYLDYQKIRERWLQGQESPSDPAKDNEKIQEAVNTLVDYGIPKDKSIEFVEELIAFLNSPGKFDFGSEFEKSNQTITNKKASKLEQSEETADALKNTQFSDLPNDVKSIFFESPKFKYITLDLIPEDKQGEIQVDRPDFPNKILGGFSGENFFYQNSLSNKLNETNDSLYAFLHKNNYLEFVGHRVPYRRANTKKIFSTVLYDYHHYTDSLLGFVSDGKLLLAKRDLSKITYRNEYRQNFGGIDATVIAITFNYNINANLPKMPSPGLSKTYEGSGKAVLDPDDGKWKLIEFNLGDSGIIEVISLLPPESIKSYITQKLKDKNEQLRMARNDSLSKAQRIDYHLNQDQESLVMLLTSDDAIEIQPEDERGYSHIQWITEFANDHVVDKYPYAFETHLKDGALGGTGYSWETGQPLFIDLHNYEGRKNVKAFFSHLTIKGRGAFNAKIVIYCVENNDDVVVFDEYGYFTKRESLNCSKRFRRDQAESRLEITRVSVAEAIGANGEPIGANSIFRGDDRYSGDRRGQLSVELLPMLSNCKSIDFVVPKPCRK
jgi:hypothetical protein